jgi:hypothetical protein
MRWTDQTTILCFVIIWYLENKMDDGYYFTTYFIGGNQIGGDARKKFGI